MDALLTIPMPASATLTTSLKQLIAQNEFPPAFSQQPDWNHRQYAYAGHYLIGLQLHADQLTYQSPVSNLVVPFGTLPADTLKNIWTSQPELLLWTAVIVDGPYRNTHWWARKKAHELPFRLNLVLSMATDTEEIQRITAYDPAGLQMIRKGQFPKCPHCGYYVRGLKVCSTCGYEVQYSK
ncbi:hypothetical protein [Lactobacillus selangorensis]|nr:hypothetical protein [Lactobacillus selangorensis]